MTALKFVKNSGVMAAASRRVFARSTAYRSAAMFARHNSTKSEHQSTPPPPPSKGNSAPIAILAALAIGGAGYYYYSSGATGMSKLTAETATFSDFQNVYNQIAKKLIDDESDPDEGSYGPVWVRIAWHASGTFDKSKGDGGSYKGTMQYKTELGHGANSGLARARDFLASIAEKEQVDFATVTCTPSVVLLLFKSSVAPLSSGALAESAPESETVVEGRLPDASRVLPTFATSLAAWASTTARWLPWLVLTVSAAATPSTLAMMAPGPSPPPTLPMTFSSCSSTRSGTFVSGTAPSSTKTKRPSLWWCCPPTTRWCRTRSLRSGCRKYAADNDFFFSEFSKAFSRLLELGCSFKADSKPFEFKRLDDQEN